MSKPIGFLEHEQLEKLRDPMFSIEIESHVRLWHADNPPSRAVIPLYTAPPPADQIGDEVEEAAYVRVGVESVAGWKLVPIEPTQEMRKGGLAHTGAVSATYRDMIAAAPPPASTNRLTDDQRATLNRLAMILEAGQAENGIDHARAQTYAEALRAIIAATEGK